MKKELLKKLGHRYEFDGNNLIDRTVQGFKMERNVAQIREVRGHLFVNLFAGHWYKPGEEKEFSSVDEAVSFIRGENCLSVGPLEGDRMRVRIRASGNLIDLMSDHRVSGLGVVVSVDRNYVRVRPDVSPKEPNTWGDLYLLPSEVECLHES